MPDPVETVNMVDQQGGVHAVPVNAIAEAARQGFRVESALQGAERASQEAREDIYGGIGGQTVALGAGVLRGLTLGGSDVAFRGLYGDEGAAQLDTLRDINPGISTAGNIAGAIAPVLLTAGAAAPEEGAMLGASLLKASPAALSAKLGAKVAGLGEGAGAFGRIAATAGGGAVEGALQNAGAYVSDVALGDKELAADAFMAEMGKGALWGGVAAGALAGGAEATMAARRLFPAAEMTTEHVVAAQQQARQAVREVVDNSDELERAARTRLREIRADHAALDLETKRRLDDIAVRKAQEISDAQVASAQAKSEAAIARAERGPTRRAFQPTAAENEAGTAAAEVSSSKPMSWREFTSGKMGEYMKSEGGHAGAMSRLSREWKDYKAGLSSSSMVASDTAETGMTSLERQLSAMKQGVDQGMSLQDLSSQRPKAIGMSPTHVEDALNAEIAKVNPEAERLAKGLQELSDSREAMTQWLEKYGDTGKAARLIKTIDYTEGMRPTAAGYYTRTPAGEGSVGLPRGMEKVFRGTEAEREAAELGITSKIPSEERAAIDADVDRMFGRRAESDEIDERIKSALGTPADDINDDVAESAAAITRLEAAHAEVTEALGPMAPMSAQSQAVQFREAQKGAQKSLDAASAEAAANAERAAETISLGIDPPQLRKGGGFMELAKDAATAAEALRLLGINVPDPKNIPVIGPVLSMYLKARMLGKAFGRRGGQVLETADSTVAAKAASAKQRVYRAVDSMLGLAAEKTSKAAPLASAPAVILAHTLFDDGKPASRPYTSEPKPKYDIQQTYLARVDEIDRAMRPGAIREAVATRMPGASPAVIDAVVAAQERKFQYLDEQRPKTTEPALPTTKTQPYVPSKAGIATFARTVQAVEDPAGVLAAAAAGFMPSVEAIAAIHAVYPKMIFDAQLRLLDSAHDAPEIPYNKRSLISAVFGIPMDASHTPEGAFFLQQAYQPPPPPPTPQGAGGSPTVSADVSMAQRSDPSTKEL